MEITLIKQVFARVYSATMRPLASFYFLSPLLVAGVSCTTPTATLDSGPIFGIQTTLPSAIAPVNKFMGIPYAAPPERFELPQKPKSWKKPLNTSEFGPSCLQNIPISPGLGPGQDVFDGLFNQHGPESEDCLYLNAFAPATEGPPDGRPVVLFIHGGGWQLSNGIIDLSGFAGYEDIVAISFNYRTNIFGFPNSPDIPLDKKNLGLYDQQRAIEWTQANAAAFGGDPAKVTIWGESAGSLSVDAQINAYADSDPPPFRAGIMFSGQMSYGLLGSTTNASDPSAWDAVADGVGCGNATDQLACLRKVKAEEIVDVMNTTGTTFSPVTDGVTMMKHMAEAWRNGDVAKVPVLMGTIAQEGRSLVNHYVDMDLFLQAYLFDPIVTQKQRDAILEYYRAKPELKNDFDVASAIYTDFFWQCPQGMLASTSASIDNPTWRYYFNISITSILPPEFSWLEKFHGSDVALLFMMPTFEATSDEQAENPLLPPQLYAFANYLRGVVGRFVRNPTGGPGWPAVGSGYAPMDVADLGDLGFEKTAGATPVNATELDANCFLYKDIYPLIDKWVL